MKSWSCLVRSLTHQNHQCPVSIHFIFYKIPPIFFIHGHFDWLFLGWRNFAYSRIIDYCWRAGPYTTPRMVSQTREQHRTLSSRFSFYCFPISAISSLAAPLAETRIPIILRMSFYQHIQLGLNLTLLGFALVNWRIACFWSGLSKTDLQTSALYCLAKTSKNFVHPQYCWSTLWSVLSRLMLNWISISTPYSPLRVHSFLMQFCLSSHPTRPPFIFIPRATI